MNARLLQISKPEESSLPGEEGGKGGEEVGLDIGVQEAVLLGLQGLSCSRGEGIVFQSEFERLGEILQH